METREARIVTLPPAQVAAQHPSRTSGTQVLLVMLFAIYLALLVWAVLWKLHVPFIGRDDMREIKLVPFASDSGYGPSSPAEVIANLLLFVPFGIYLGALAPRWAWWRVLAVVAGASLVLEVAQYVTAVGSSDVTDLIVNTAGGLVGFILVAAVRHRLQSRTAAVMTGILAVGTVIALIGVGAMVASFPRIAPPHQLGTSGEVTIR